MDKANGNSSSKVNNVILNQCRLHGVTSVCVKKLTIALPNESSEYDDRSIKTSKHLLYFTLHASPTSSSNNNVQELYSSENIHHSENPTWSSFKITDRDVGLATEFVVRLCISHGNSYLPALQWNISITQLYCIGESSLNEKFQFNSNAVVIGINNFYYVPYLCINNQSPSPPLTSILPSYDLNNPRKSYSNFSLSRIISLQSTKRRTIEAKERMSLELCKMLKNRDALNFKEKRETLKERNETMNKLLARETSLLNREKQRRDAKREVVKELNNDLQESTERQTIGNRAYESSKKSYNLMYDNFYNVKAQKDQREKDLIGELTLIFPITCSPAPPPKNHSDSGKNDCGTTDTMEYRICGAKLPNSEQFNQKEDSATSVALGFTSQLLIMFSRFTFVPLRYPVHFNGSMSSIYDHATSDISEKNRIFPLHFKGNKDRLIFKYGVFLLNKSIAQMRYHFVLTTPDLRPTLHNLNSLLQERTSQLSKPTIFIPSSPIKIVNNDNNSLHIQKSPRKSPSFNGNGRNDEISNRYSSSTTNSSVTSSNDFFKAPKTKGTDQRRMTYQSKRMELFGTKQTKKSQQLSPQGARRASTYTGEHRTGSMRDNISSSNMSHSSDPTKSEKCTRTCSPTPTESSPQLLTGLESNIGGEKKHAAYEDERAQLLGYRSSSSLRSDERRASSPHPHPTIQHSHHNNNNGKKNDVTNTANVQEKINSLCINDDDDDLC